MESSLSSIPAKQTTATPPQQLHHGNSNGNSTRATPPWPESESRNTDRNKSMASDSIPRITSAWQNHSFSLCSQDAVPRRGRMSFLCCRSSLDSNCILGMQPCRLRNSCASPCLPLASTSAGSLHPALQAPWLSRTWPCSWQSLPRSGASFP